MKMKKTKTKMKKGTKHCLLQQSVPKIENKTIRIVQ